MDPCDLFSYIIQSWFGVVTNVPYVILTFSVKLTDTKQYHTFQIHTKCKGCACCLVRNAAACRRNTGSFLEYSHNRHSIAHPLGTIGVGQNVSTNSDLCYSAVLYELKSEIGLRYKSTQLYNSLLLYLVNLTQWWYFFIIFEYILHISTPHIMIFCFPLPYFPLSTSALFFA